MEDRVLRRARKTGFDEPSLQRMKEAHRHAMAVRTTGVHALPAEDHPSSLHPGRVALILLDDFEEEDPAVVLAGLLAESRDLDLRLEESVAEAVLGGVEGSLDIWQSLPRIRWRTDAPGEEVVDAESDSLLLETLVIASPEVQRVAMAEALDQLRHAHLWESAEDRRRAATLARKVMAPLAPRIHPTLERRIDWWVRRVSPGL